LITLVENDHHRYSQAEGDESKRLSHVSSEGLGIRG
jgi:hypothetical protein